jgi:murein DD-endopeptidase MepM/ murein hydrolase activator NlpD
MRLRAAALLLLVAAAPADTPMGVVRLHPPLPAPCVSSPFGPRAGQMHRGTDLPAPAGAWVTAAAAGRVVSIRRIGASGLAVELRHADGSRTRYAHLGTVTPALAEGRAEVAAGERLGRVGRTGVSRGTHLHFELFLTNEPVDAAPILQLRACRRTGD